MAIRLLLATAVRFLSDFQLTEWKRSAVAFSELTSPCISEPKGRRRHPLESASETLGYAAARTC